MQEEEERKKKLKKMSKPRKQGWHKPGSSGGKGSTQTSSHSTPNTPRSGGRDSRDHYSQGSTSGGSSRRSRRSSKGQYNAPPREVMHTPTGDKDDVSMMTMSVMPTPNTVKTSKSAGSNNSSSVNDHVADALVQAMNDESMCDITLLGLKGVKVRATKFVLACRSPSLKEKLYANPSATEMYMGDYSENTLRAFKQFCHHGNTEQTAISKQRNADAGRDLVDLAFLGKAYDLEALYCEADSMLCEILEGGPWLATAAYDAAGHKSVQCLDEYLLQFIKGRCPDLLLETSAIKHFSAERLDNFLEAMECNDAETLLYLMKWVEIKGPSRENVSSAERLADEKVDLRKLLADPVLIQVARSSGLFDDEVIQNTLYNLKHGIADEHDEEDAYQRSVASSSVNGSSGSRKSKKDKKKHKR